MNVSAAIPNLSPALVDAALADGLPGGPVAPASAARFVLPGTAGEALATRAADWLCLRARPAAVGEAAGTPTLALLRVQAGWPCAIKLALSLDSPAALDVRAECFVPESGPDPAQVQQTLADLAAALVVLAGRCGAGVSPAPPAAPADSSGPGSRMLNVKMRPQWDWPARTRPDGSLEVSLEPGGASGSAVLIPEPVAAASCPAQEEDPPASRQEVGTATTNLSGSIAQPFRATVHLLELERFDTPLAQRALAFFLFRLNAAVRGARASVVGQDGTAAVVLEAHGHDAASEAEVAAVLSSLSVACRLAGTAAEALNDWELSRHYLAVMGGEPPDTETANHNPDTNT